MKKRMIRAIVAAFLLAGLIPALPATAQESDFAKAGTTEIAGGISFSSIIPVSNGETGDATTIFSFGPEIGYFVTDGLEIGLNPGVTLLPGMSIITPSSGNGATVFQFFAYPAYNFRSEGSVVHPFIQVPLGYASMSSGDDSQSGFSWGVKAGLKVVAASHFLVTFYGEYLLLTLNPEQVTERNGFNFLSFGVSVGGFF